MDPSSGKSEETRPPTPAEQLVESQENEASLQTHKDLEDSDKNPAPGEDETPAASASIVDIATHDLAENVSAFLKNLDPWKAIMPTALRDRMMFIRNAADKITSISLPDPPRPEPWSFDIPQNSMETWNEGPPVLHEFSSPVPALLAYYQTPGLEASSERYHFDSPLVEKNLQRIVIMSSILHDEIRLVTSISLRYPMAITPPYKLLLEYLPQLKTRLSQLEKELHVSKATSVRPGPGVPDSSDECQDSQDQVDEKSQDLPDEIGSTFVSRSYSTGRLVPKRNLPRNPETGSTTDFGESNESERSDESESEEEEPHDYLVTRITHLRCLIEFIDNNLGDQIQQKAAIADGSLDLIAFDDLWHLFKPGDLVVSREWGREKLSLVYFVSGGQVVRNRSTSRYSDYDGSRVIGSWNPLRLSTFMMDFDGTAAGPVAGSVLIKYYTGKKSITALPAYPLRFHPDKSLLARFEKRGRQFMSSVGHKYYEGPALSDTGSRGYDIASDVYVDFQEFNQTLSHSHRYTEGPELGRLETPSQDLSQDSEVFPTAHGQTTQEYCGHEVDTRLFEVFSSHNRSFLDPFNPSEEPERLIPEFYQLLPQHVPAYVFRYRQWYTLDIDLIRPIEPDHYSGFDNLVIPSHYKELLTALVNNHVTGIQKRKEKLPNDANSFNTNIDVVAGKGEGLIVLLHGPPGSGKTSTAETIAAYTNRPLYALTCGDIGLTPEVAERNLISHTLRADKWGCVLLLDEADVFLMQRTWKEIERNALVSVFLRQLEYYSGILFLTTNRPGTIDEAFKSRIHVSLRYPGIDLTSTNKMWENIMDRLEVDNKLADVKVEFDRGKLLAFAQQHYMRHAPTATWNGRQIRNAFQTALALGHAARQAALREANMTPEDAAAHRNKKKWMTVKLTAANFRKVAKTTTEFENYIVALRGKDADAARESEVRDDNYDPDMAGPGRKNYGGSSGVSGGGGVVGADWGWGGGGHGLGGQGSGSGGGGGGRWEVAEPSSVGYNNSRNVGKGKAPRRQATALSGMDSEEEEDDDEDDDEGDEDDDMD